MIPGSAAATIPYDAEEIEIEVLMKPARAARGPEYTVTARMLHKLEGEEASE